MRRLLILGVGNPVLSDDRVGLAVAEKLRQNPLRAPAGVEIAVNTATEAGLEFTEKLAGFDSAIVVDSIKTGEYAVGTVREIGMDDLGATSRLLTSHGVGFKSAVELGRTIGLDMPADENIRIFTVEIAENLTVSEHMHPDVVAAVDVVIENVRAVVGENELS
jgi:hydrogenase maturation protease